MSPVTGQVLSVQFEGGLPVSDSRRSQATALPNWEDTGKGPGQFFDGDGSIRPAVYRISEEIRARAEVEIAGTGNTGAVGTLRGSLGNLALMGPISFRDGRQSVMVAQTGPPESVLRRHAGDVDWVVRGPAPPAILGNATRLEVFRVFGQPQIFFPRQLWAGTLRLLIDSAQLDGVAGAPTAMDRITHYCHSVHGLIYDTAGSPLNPGLSVNSDGGRFNLSVFLSRAPTQVVCFDVSGAVLVLGSAVGIPVAWLKIEHFGYIVKTELVGIGPCNSPFYVKKGTGPVVESHDGRRSCFGRHAFCEASNGTFNAIFDACVGPHQGTEDRGSYLRAAVDEDNPGCPSCNPTIPSEHGIMDFTSRLIQVI